jgi:glycosyltransferase involved in cell wall biosynthesis
MQILFDARVLGAGMHGIARYCQGLLGRLLADDGENEYLVLIGRDEVRQRFKTAGPVRWIRTSIPLYGPAEQILLPLRLAGLTFDLYHSPTFTIPLSFAAKGIITLHDLIPLLFPEDYGIRHRLFFRLIVTPACARAFKVATVSQASAKDIVSLLKVSEERIVITPNGLDPLWTKGGEEKGVLWDEDGEGRFILFVGNPKPHKNFRRVLAAFEKLKEEDGYPGKLVVVGLSGQDVGGALKGEVLFFPRLDDAALIRLYTRADLLASPSLYEGFGLPVLEAMACGCPVVIGDRGALPEVAGAAGFQVNPLDIRAIKEGMRELIENQTLRAALREEGKKGAARFTWDRSTQVVRESYRQWNGAKKGIRAGGSSRPRGDEAGERSKTSGP